MVTLVPQKEAAMIRSHETGSTESMS